MRMNFALAAGCAAALACTPAQAMSADSWGKVSDIGAAGLGAVALGLPLIKGDTTGVWQGAASIGTASAVAFGLKQFVQEERPDHSGNDSFPSAHAAFAFSAAATIQEREGWQVGLPAQLVAVLVGVARVQADKHHWYDVAAGAAIGEISGFLWTKPFNDDVQVTPWADSKGGGVAMAMRF